MKEYIECDCGCSVICLEEDKEFDLFCLSVFNSPFRGKLSWKERIRWAFNLLKTGHPYTDMVVLDKEGLSKLKNFFNKAGEE